MVRVVGVAELALSLPIVTCTFEIVANGDVYQQIDDDVFYLFFQKQE